MDNLIQDVRYALRLLLKSRLFTLTALLTLGFGIGVNVAVFSIVNAVLLQEIPYRNPERLMFVTETLNEKKLPVSYPNYLDWKQQNRVFEEVAAFSDDNFNMSVQKGVERVTGELVTEMYFSVLGVSPIRGRTFSPDENNVAGKHPVLVLSHGCWTRRFGSDPSLVGKTLKLNDTPFTIIGILPKGFDGISGEAEIWLPMAMRDVLSPQTAQFHFLQARDIHWHSVIARLKPGISPMQANTEMDTIGKRLAKSYPQANEHRSATVLPAAEVLVGKLRKPLYLLVAAVGFILLIGCLNLANLLLSRGIERNQEIALRQALGATRWRLFRQMVTESILISILGGVLGIVLASWGMDLLLSLLPMTLPSFVNVRIDRAVLAFTLFLSVFTGLLLSMAPLFQFRRKELNSRLQQSGGRLVGDSRIRNVLVVSEIALALILMIGAGLMIKSFQQLRSVNPGFNPSRLLNVRFEVPSKYEGPQRAALATRVLQQAETIPGVRSAALNYSNLFVWSGIRRGFSVADRPPLSPAEQDSVYFQDISPNFFKTLEIPLFSGRDFTSQDRADTPLVAIVSQAFAKRIWPKENPLGKRIKYGPFNSDNQWITVVGVAGDVKHRDLRRDPYADPVVYVPLPQSQIIIGMSLIVRTEAEPAHFTTVFRDAIQNIDSDIPVYNISTVEERIAEQTTLDRSYSFLLGFLALLALLLSVIGIYGVMSYSVARRRREIGLRMALGAARRDVFRMIVTQGMFLTVSGICIGVVASIALTRLIQSQLFHVSPTDPETFVLISTLLAAVSLTGSYFPAGRATKIDPGTALRYE